MPAKHKLDDEQRYKKHAMHVTRPIKRREDNLLIKQFNKTHSKLNADASINHFK
jgi:hypothetical protein